MRLTRRVFFQGLAASIATVAIALRMAPKFLPDGLRGGTWRYEQATEKYFYGVDLAKPWDIQIFEQTDFHDPESWKLMDAKELMKRAYDKLVSVEREVQVGPNKHDPDQLFVCDLDERWPWNNISQVTHETIEEVGVDVEAQEEMEACSIIAMSQGFAVLQVEGGANFQHGYDFPTEELGLDVVTIPTISTTREELFRHGPAEVAA